MAAVPSSGIDARRLIALIGGQICLHSSMAGLRLAAPLMVLESGRSAWWVGVLLALFAAAPIFTALQAGRLADRRGYHQPLRVAVGLALIGGAAALVSTFLSGAGSWAQYAALCVAAAFSGAGANFGLIVIQRSAGRSAAGGLSGESSATELKRMFSWLGLAPSVANMVGPLAAGVLVDAAGYGAAFAVLAALPLGALWWARQVPREQLPSPAAAKARTAAQPMWRSAVELAGTPGMRRLLLVNWLLSASWDVHAFVVPLLGHSRGLSASAIGANLGVFGLAVSLVRLLIPVLAHRLREAQVLAVSMVIVATVFALYPFAQQAWTMGVCAAVLGLALGAVQPMIMSTLHQLSPQHRQGEAIALRSMTINLSSTLMPLGFGLIGATLGAAGLFWVMGAMVGAGAWPARRLGASRADGEGSRAQ